MELPAFSYPEEIGDRALLNREIEEYLRGERTCFSETLCEQVRQGIARVGTPFQQRVWSEMMRIPYGSTVSYSELARRIGQPKATRAVGNACHRNPFLLVVPCHRVVAAHSLGGFALGLPTKQNLLHHEATNINKANNKTGTKANNKTNKADTTTNSPAPLAGRGAGGGASQSGSGASNTNTATQKPNTMPTKIHWGEKENPLPRTMNTPYLREKRRDLRTNGTPAEAALWKMLKAKQVNGLQFRRQFSVGNHILDFYCPELHLAVELDGDYHYHTQQPGLDKQRDEELWQAYGIRVLRFENRIVFENPQTIIQSILQY